MTFLLLAAVLAVETEKPFAITVVDADTGRGVPLVELRTVNYLRFVTDSNGVVAFHEPGLMAEGVFFHVSGHGYEFPQDGFGYRGTKIQIAPGGSVTLKIHRLNVAERLYRVTGAGIYRDSLLVGRAVPLKEPVLNGKVFGSDSVMTAEYRGKMYWFWGDTNLPNYPLGNFHVTGATSEIPGHGGLDPSLGVELSYFLDKNGAAKKMAEFPGKGPTWIESLVPLTDAGGRERLYAAYVKIEPPLTTVARGVAVFDDEKRQFEKLADIPLTAAAYPHGHAFRHRDQGRDFIYFAHPFPLTRVPAMASAFADASAYQAYTCLKEGSRLDAPQIDRHADGRPRYLWKTDTPVVGPAEQAKLIADGKLKSADALLQLRDRDTGRAVTAHGGSVYWNEYRKRWVLIAVESGGGPSYLGEVWYTEADTLMGPWAYAVKVVTHDKYSFYNPKQHPTFAKDGGRTIFFEGTYTRDFSGNPDATPRYEYNQVMYGLDLSDPRAALPVPVYDPTNTGETFQIGARSAGNSVAFFALDRPAVGMIPAFVGTAKEPGLRFGPPVKTSRPVEGAAFYVLPPTAENSPKSIVPLYEFAERKTGRKRYGTDGLRVPDGFDRSAGAVGRVWKSNTAK